MGRYIWADWHGYISASSKGSIGLSKHPKGSVELWLSTIYVKEVCYIEGGDSTDIHLNKEIEAVCIPDWLADRHRLEYEDEDQEDESL